MRIISEAIDRGPWQGSCAGYITRESTSERRAAPAASPAVGIPDYPCVCMSMESIVKLPSSLISKYRRTSSGAAA